MIARKWRFLVVALVLCWMNVLAAAEGDGRIDGRIVKGGDGVAGVVVLLVEQRAVEVSDNSGKFAFKNVPPGIYTLNFTLGDNSVNETGVGVIAGQTREFELEVDWDLGVYEKITVTAAAERAAKIVDAPAAVTSIVAEELEEQASTGQLPKVLEFTPGAEVTQSGLYDFNFNTRGFNSSLNRRVSTYIDGRDVGVVLLGAQEWAAISGGLGDVASLEFIRGPSAALYGANASSGVVNITTKAPRNSMGTLVRFSTGELNTLSLDFRQANEIGRGWYYKVLAGYRESGDFAVSRNPDDTPEPEYSEYCMLIGERDCLPEERTLLREQDNDIRFGSVRFDKYFKDDSLLSFEGGATDMEGPVFQTGIGRVQIRQARRPFYRIAYARPHWNILSHYAERDGDQANLSKALVTNFDLISDTKRYGMEVQGNWNFVADRLRFVIGAAHTEEEVDTAGDTGEQTVVYAPIDTDRQAIFSQIDWRQNDHLKFVLAGRLDWNTLHDTQFSPKAAMVYSINPEHSFRFTFNKAFQVANYSEFFLHTRISAFPIQSTIDQICTSNLLSSPDPVTGEFPMDGAGNIITGAPLSCNPIPNVEFQSGGGFIPILAVGNDDLELEKTSAFEIGYSGLIAKRVFVTLDYYNSDNEDFITDLVPQVGTSLGTLTAACGTVATDCPINPDYLEWTGPDDWENTFIIDPSPFLPDPPLRASQAIRNFVDNSVGGNSLGFRLATDLDGESAAIIARTYTNVGQVDTQGIDLGLQFFISSAWSMQASYSWFDFDIADDVSISAEEVADILLPNSPEHKASMSISFRKGGFSGNVSGRWTQGFRWSAGVFQGDVPDYYTTDLTANYRFNDLIAVGLNVANVVDNVHRQTFGGDFLERRALTNIAFTW